MTFDARAYWASGLAPVPTFRHGWAAQERELRAVLADYGDTRDVLEVGCGRGRIAALLADALPGASYTGIDVGAEQVAATRAVRPDGDFIIAALQDWEPLRRGDLTIAVEVLMHIPPSDIAAVCDKLLRSARVLITVDWTPTGTYNVDPAEWNWAHFYEPLLRPTRMTRVGEQTIFEVLR